MQENVFNVCIYERKVKIYVPLYVQMRIWQEHKNNNEMARISLEKEFATIWFMKEWRQPLIGEPVITRNRRELKKNRMESSVEWVNAMQSYRTKLEKQDTRPTFTKYNRSKNELKRLTEWKCICIINGEKSKPNMRSGIWHMLFCIWYVVKAKEYFT